MIAQPELIDGGHGIDIQRREGGTGWPAKWRVRVIRNKNERSEYRITAYGDTIPAALSAAMDQYNAVRFAKAKDDKT